MAFLDENGLTELWGLTKDYADKAGYQMELLWENASPGSKFPAQTIEFEDGYDLFEIHFGKTNSASQQTDNIRLPVGKTAYVQQYYSSGDNYYRIVTASTATSVTFDASNYMEQGVNPLRIYGIKGVRA